MRPDTTIRIGDLISISSAPAVISLSDVERLRDDLNAGRDAGEGLRALVGSYSLADEETRAAFEAIIRSLGRDEERGDAFLLQGVYGAGKSHLLAALTLLCGHADQACPVFLAAHPDFDMPDSKSPRLVVTVALDEYTAQTHPLEYIVLSRIEAELANRHRLQVALTDESHLLDLVARYVLPQAGDALDARVEEEHGLTWQELRAHAPAKAAEVALDFLKQTGFPLDWRRSRAEAWGQLRRALAAHGIIGPVVLLDELGTFLAGKDRRGINADASFLQYLAQRSASDSCWLICVTQRGLEEVGDIDRRTLRQLRDRFRPAFILDLSGLEWVVQQRLVRKKDPELFQQTTTRLYHEHASAAGELPFSAGELARSYPLNPLCLQAVQRAAETCLSRTRSAVQLLQQTMVEGGWTELPANRLVTLDVAFDVFRGEMPLTSAGQRHLHAYEVVMANAGRIAPGREGLLSPVMKALCLLGLGELRWSERQLRASLVGCAEPELWQNPELLPELLHALHRRGAYVERSRREGEEADEFYLDISSDASERIRQRLTELLAELKPDDSRVARAALESCREAAFPLAALAEPRTLSVIWSQARRYVGLVCRDLSRIGPAELQNLAGELESPNVREDARLFLAIPTVSLPEQEAAWRNSGSEASARFSSGLLAWLPRELSETEVERLIEHAALASMVVDRTLPRRRDREFREKLRARWADAESEARQMLQRAYYEGRVIGLDGEEAIEPERLGTLFGDWEETLRAIFAASFRELFPGFGSVAPARRLVGRAQTNQIIDQFIRPGEANLPPASTLEAHLLAYAVPLGLVTGEQCHPRLALKNRALLESAIEAAPPRSGSDQIDPSETISYSEFAGRLAKSHWGLTHEQAELLIAALIRTGHLVALDAFLEPVRLDAVAAPLGDNLPYVMRGAALTGKVAERAALLSQAVSGEGDGPWDLPRQERAWGDIIAWAGQLRGREEEGRAAIARAAGALCHRPESWTWAEEALARANALARDVEAALTSKGGLTKLVRAAERLPGGVEGTARLVATWQACELFFESHLGDLARLRGLVTDERMESPQQSLLAKDRRSVLDHLDSPQRLVSDPQAAAALGRRLLEGYRRHYLAWHSRVHAANRFEGLTQLRQSPVLEAARRLARAGICTEEAALIEVELGRALGRRCLAGDPLPSGVVVCPICSIRLGREIDLPDLQELAKRAEETLAKQRDELRGRADLLKRRLRACRDGQVIEAMKELLGSGDASSWEQPEVLLGEPVIAWLRRQLGQPQAKRRELQRLAESLQGKELAARDVRQIVEEWLAAAEDDVLEIV